MLKNFWDDKLSKFFFPFPITIRGHLSIVFFLFQYCTWFILCVRVCVCLRSGSGQKYSLIFLDFFWCDVLFFKKKKFPFHFLYSVGLETLLQTHTHTHKSWIEIHEIPHTIWMNGIQCQEKNFVAITRHFILKWQQMKKKIKQDKKKTLKIST